MAEKKRRFRPPVVLCSGKKLNGEPCRSRPHPESPDARCMNHTQDPELRARQHAIASSGGKASSNVARALTIAAAGPYAGVLNQLGEAMRDVALGKMDPNRLSALAQGARALVAVFDAAKTEERGDRLEALLEKALATGAFAKPVGESAGVVIRDPAGQEIPMIETSEGTWEPADADGDPPWVRARGRSDG